MAENTPSQTFFGYDAGRKKDCLIGENFQAIPVTIDTTRFGSDTESIKGPRLWVRGNVSPYYAYPYGFGGEVSSVSTKYVTLVNAADSYHFVVGDRVSFFDYSTGVFGGVQGYVTAVNNTTGIVTLGNTLTGLTGDDLLVVVSGEDCGWICSGQLSDMNACVILEDVELSSASDSGTKAYIEGTFIKSEVKGFQWLPAGQTIAKDMFNKNNNQKLHFIDIVT